MTRINFGIEPAELSDQHLVAEYRELPRLWKYIETPPANAPTTFRLGKGHVLWCAMHLGAMADRYLELVAEMQHRGFACRWPSPPASAHLGRPAPAAEVACARAALIPRIQERLAGMASPRWTRRQPPAWALPTVASQAPPQAPCGVPSPVPVPYPPHNTHNPTRAHLRAHRNRAMPAQNLTATLLNTLASQPVLPHTLAGGVALTADTVEALLAAPVHVLDALAFTNGCSADVIVKVDDVWVQTEVVLGYDTRSRRFVAVSDPDYWMGDPLVRACTEATEKNPNFDARSLQADIEHCVNACVSALG